MTFTSKVDTTTITATIHLPTLPTIAPLLVPTVPPVPTVPLPPVPPPLSVVLGVVDPVKRAVVKEHLVATLLLF